MKIIEIQALHNGAHRNQEGDISTIPDGYAIIPEDMPIPDTYPFVDIEVADAVYTYTMDVEVPYVDEETGETFMSAKTQEVECTISTVTSMTAGVMPEPGDPTPTQLDIIEAQVTYTAMMTDTLLEV